MDQRLIDLYVERGRLRERIGVQRAQAASALAPLGNVLQSVDRGRVLMREARIWVVTHPVVVTTVVVALVVWRPRAVFRVVRGGYALWRNASHLQQWVSVGLRTL